MLKVDVSEEGTWDLDLPGVGTRGQRDIRQIFLNRILPGGRGIFDISSSIGSSAPTRGQRDIRPMFLNRILPGGRGILDTCSSIGSSAPTGGQRDIRHMFLNRIFCSYTGAEGY